MSANPTKRPRRCDAHYSYGGYLETCRGEATDAVYETSTRADVRFCVEHEREWNADFPVIVEE